MPPLAVVKCTLCSEMDALYADLKLEPAGRAPLAALFLEFSEMTCIIFFSFLLLYSHFSLLPCWEPYVKVPFTLDEICTVFSYHSFPFVDVFAFAVQKCIAVVVFRSTCLRREMCEQGNQTRPCALLSLFVKKSGLLWGMRGEGQREGGRRKKEGRCWSLII